MKLLHRKGQKYWQPWLKSVAVSVAAIAAGKLAIKLLRPTMDLQGKVALITGGSRGLGFCLADELGQRGCRLALCARNEEELESAREKLSEKGFEVAIFPCDVSHESEIAPLVSRVLDQFGRVDILVNNAGIIKVGPLDSFEHADFEQAMNTMFWAPANLTLAVLPVMKRQNGGSIVNITSVGGRVSVPHLLPYCCAKFAFVAFSNGLNAELHREGLHGLTVVPGLMRTGSYLNAQFTGRAEREFAWFGILGNLPGCSVSASYAARRIVNALQHRSHNCTISLPAKALIRFEACAPELTQALLGAVNRYLMPSSDGKRETLSGKASNISCNPVFQAFTILGKRAAQQLNE